MWSAFAGGVGFLCVLLSTNQGLWAQRVPWEVEPHQWGVHFRAADPGIWTVAARFRGRMRPSNGGGWQGHAQWDQGGAVQLRLQQWVALDDQVKLGSGLGLHFGGTGSLLFSVGVQDWVAHFSIPVYQPAQRPYHTEWQWSLRLPLVRESQGMVDIQWHPGSLPLLSLTAMSNAWSWGIGSTGGWLSCAQPMFGSDRSVEWRLTLGVLRGDIPWAGVDFGSVTALGSDPAQYWHLPWMLP